MGNELIGLRGIHRAHIRTRAAIGAFIRVYDIDLITHGNRLNRTFTLTCTTTDAVTGNNVSHRDISFTRSGSKHASYMKFRKSFVKRKNSCFNC
jgi:hypothetical protein